MMRFSFKKGLVFREINIRWTLLRRLVTGKLQLENEEGEIKNISDKEVLNLWHAGVWLVDLDTLGNSTDAIYLTTPAELSTYPTRWQEVAKRRLHYVNVVGGGDEKFNKQKWDELISKKAQEIADKKPPCAESVFHWVKKYRISKSISSLLPKVKSGHSRKDDERYAIFEDVIKSSYLNQQKLPIKEIFERVRLRLTLLNASRPSEKAIKKIGQSTIYRWVNSLRADIADAARLGASAARNMHRVAYKHLKVEAVLERYEMDHTPLDIIVIDSITKLALGRPWLTLLIDAKTRVS